MHEFTSTAGAPEGASTDESVIMPAKRRRDRQTASKRWFGGDGRQSLGFYGEFYRQPMEVAVDEGAGRPPGPS